MYNVSITESDARDGTFIATWQERAPNLEIEVTSRDPEYDMAKAMKDASLEDGPVQFWRGTTPSLSFKSVHAAAEWRIALDERSPFNLVRRREKPEIFKNPSAGVAKDG